MIGFSLRLAVAGGREAITRLIVIAAAVAIGVALLAATVAGFNAVNTQAARYEWLTPPDTGGPLLWEARSDYFHGDTLGRVDVAVTGPGAPVPAGLSRLPGPGEYFVSPAMQRLLSTTPADQLGDRFPGHEVGLVGDAALPAPDSLMIVIGRQPDDVAKMPDVRKVSGFTSTTSIAMSAAGFDLVLSVVAAGLLFPILMLIGTATRLSAARREQRFAAMRLVGATPRQVTTIATVEAAVSAIVGTAAGFVLFYALRSTFARIPFTGRRFFTSDLSLGALGTAAVAIGIPVAAAVVARLALRRVNISPLGVTRRVTPKPPGAWRLIPVAIGLTELAYFIGRRPNTSLGQVGAFLPGCLITMAGLVIAGPWLTMVASRVLARRAGRPAALIAARRLADNPKAAFRSVSGLILALFVASVAVGIITTIVYHRGGPTTGGAATNVRQFEPPPGPLPVGLSSIPGVQKVVIVYEAPEPRPAISGGSLPPGWTPDGLVRCGDIAGRPDFGRCQAGAEVAAVFPDLSGPTDLVGDNIVWPTADIAPDQLSGLRTYSYLVGTDGAADTIERVRTTLIMAYPTSSIFPATEAEWDSDFARTLTGWKQLANVIIVSSMVLAGCSLAVSVVGGLTDRKRPFSMLRLTGIQLGALRRVVTLETAVPLLSAAVVAIAVGLLTAHLFLVAQMHYSLRPPGLSYVVIVVAGLVVSFGIVGSTFPLLRRITGPETARNE